jgi:hypothetical protein
MTRDDSTMTSLRDLLALETARVEQERAHEIEKAEALAREAQRSREESERKALAVFEARQREDRERRERELAEESARQTRELEARLRDDHAAKMRALDEKLARERAEFAALNAKIAAQQSRSTKVLAVVSLAALAAIVALGVRLSSNIDASIREARVRADRAALATQSATVAVSSPIVAPTVAPIAAAPVAQSSTVRPARSRLRPRAQQTTSTQSNDPFSQLSNIDRAEGPINGTDR